MSVRMGIPFVLLVALQIFPAEVDLRTTYALSLSKISVGMSKGDVLKLVGRPDDTLIQHHDNVNFADAQEIWAYGTNGEHLAFPVFGQIFIDSSDLVIHIMGGQGSPPPSGTIDESDIQLVMRVLDLQTGCEGWSYDPRKVIEAVNLLQPLGKEKALTAISEYLRVASKYDIRARTREGILMVLRVLFDSESPPRMLSGISVPPEPPKTDSDRFPILICNDIPFLLIASEEGTGELCPVSSHINYFKKYGKVRKSPLCLPDNPLKAIDSAFKSSMVASSDFEKQMLLKQFLLVLSPVYRSKSSEVSIDEFETKIRPELQTLKLKWNAVKSAYTLKK